MLNDNRPTPEQKEVLKTFDIYRCFSRIDVVLALIFIALGVLALLWFFFSGNNVA